MSDPTVNQAITFSNNAKQAAHTIFIVLHRASRFVGIVQWCASLGQPDNRMGIRNAIDSKYSENIAVSIAVRRTGASGY